MCRPDKPEVRLRIPQSEPEKAPTIPWALEITAVSSVEPSHLVRTLSGAILGCGGWVLSRGTNDTGRVTFLFEFERQVCVEIYSMLIAVGVELSQSGHLRLTELCHCTRNQLADCGAEIASVDLEIQTVPAKAAGNPSAKDAQVGEMP